jgi:hypothetical protein
MRLLFEIFSLPISNEEFIEVKELKILNVTIEMEINEVKNENFTNIK